jgi:hypothetical protein
VSTSRLRAEDAVGIVDFAASVNEQGSTASSALGVRELEPGEGTTRVVEGRARSPREPLKLSVGDRIVLRTAPESAQREDENECELRTERSSHLSSSIRRRRAIRLATRPAAAALRKRSGSARVPFLPPSASAPMRRQLLLGPAHPLST